MSARRKLITETRQPFDLSSELQATIDELDLGQTVGSIKDHGYGYVRSPTSIEFNDRLRKTLLRLSKNGYANMLLNKDPIIEDVVLNPKILAIVEVMCGKGAMLSQLACSVKPKGGAALGLHADQNWTPAPFPVHNQLVTFCWACDEFTRAGGSTKVIPGSHKLRRHPSNDEIASETGAIAMECDAGTLAVWDGSIWHGSWPRTLEGERVVLHVTYSRLALRPVECYDFLGEDWLEGKPEKMREILGREDFLNTEGGAFANPGRLQRTMDWAKT